MDKVTYIWSLHLESIFVHATHESQSTRVWFGFRGFRMDCHQTSRGVFVANEPFVDV